MSIKLAIGATVSQTIRAFYRGQLDYLVNRGYRITLITAPDPGLRRELPPEVALHFVDFSRELTPWRDLKTLAHLIRFLRQERFDMIQYSTPKSTVLCAIASWIAGVPCRLYCMWGIYYSASEGWRRTVFKAVEKLVCSISTHISPDGKDNRAFAIAEGLFPEFKSSIVGEGSANGIDLGRFDPERHHARGLEIREQLKAGPDDVIIGTVTRMVRDKGTEELIRAFEKLAQEQPNAHLLLVGPREDHRSPLSPEIWKIIEMHPRIHWVGPQTDVPAYYAAMDIFVLASYREGFGIVNLEASAMKLPVISTDVNGPRESIVPGKTGLLVPVREVEPLYRAMKRLADDAELRKRMGEAGRRRVIESFDARQMWRLWDEHRMALCGKK